MMDLSKVVMVLVPMILSLSVHEYAHAMVARQLGDDTAQLQGRLTLNPLSHMDFFGTFLIPFIGMMSGIPFFGWAKPVPVNPTRFNRNISMKRGMLLVAAAGPVSNLIIAFFTATGMYLMFRLGVDFNRSSNEMIRVFLHYMFMINVGLAVFNLLPIPPLDGSRILAGVAPPSLNPLLNWMNKYSFILFIAFIVLGRRFIGPLFTGVQNIIFRVVETGFSILG